MAHPKQEFRFVASSPIYEIEKNPVLFLIINLDRAPHARKLLGDLVDGEYIPLAPRPIDTRAPYSLHRPFIGFEPQSKFPDFLGMLSLPAVRVNESFGPVPSPCLICRDRLRCD